MNLTSSSEPPSGFNHLSENSTDDDSRINFSSVISIETRYTSSRRSDAIFDAIVDFLKNKTYPIFINDEHDVSAAKDAFKKKCEVFFLDKTGELLHGRAGEIHRHVLRRGELKSVVQFVHQSLGHCSAEVCMKMICPVLWSNEPMDIAVGDEIKHCGCRHNWHRRKNSCNLETTRYIDFTFTRNKGDGFTLMLRSTSNNIDLAKFQRNSDSSRTSRKSRETENDSMVLDDGRYRIMNDSELEDILEKLHIAFAHCAAFNLRILFKAHFFYPGFSMAAYQLCLRCWFCKLHGRRRRRYPIRNYEYDVEVVGNIVDPSRKFIIRPHVSLLQAINQHITAGETLRPKKRRSTDAPLMDITNNDMELPIPSVKGSGSYLHCNDLDKTVNVANSNGAHMLDKNEGRNISSIDIENSTNESPTQIDQDRSPSICRADESLQSCFERIFSDLNGSGNHGILCEGKAGLNENDKSFDGLDELQPSETQFLSHLMDHDIDSACDGSFDRLCDMSREILSAVDVATPSTPSRDVLDDSDLL